MTFQASHSFLVYNAMNKHVWNTIEKGVKRIEQVERARGTSYDVLCIYWRHVATTTMAFKVQTALSIFSVSFFSLFFYFLIFFCLKLHSKREIVIYRFTLLPVFCHLLCAHELTFAY